jgi:perosamine synthetase
MSINQTNIISEGSLSLEQVVATLGRVLEELNVPRTLHEPLFEGHEWEYLKDCIDTGWVSSVGCYVDRIEQMLAEYTGAKHAVAVVNGTAALFIAMKIAGVEPGDEVLIPALTFVATANAVAYCGATPHFVDSDLATLGMDSAKLDHYLSDIADVGSDGTRNRFTGARIKAVVPVHTFGHPVDMDPLVELCSRWELQMIEDAAESLGSFYKERHTGTFGRIGILSFNGNKIVTTGGGGALLFNNDAEAKLAKHVTTTARRPHKWEYFHDMLGYNFRMPNLNAALGCAQLENLPSFLERKRKLARQYVEAFKNVPCVKVVEEPSFAHSNYWLNALVLDENVSSQRDALLEATNANGIMTRPAWILMHHLPMYENCPRMDLSVAESLGKRIVNIPSSVSRICS